VAEKGIFARDWTSSEETRASSAGGALTGVFHWASERWIDE